MRGLAEPGSRARMGWGVGQPGLLWLRLPLLAVESDPKGQLMSLSVTSLGVYMEMLLQVSALAFTLSLSLYFCPYLSLSLSLLISSSHSPSFLFCHTCILSFSMSLCAAV